MSLLAVLGLFSGLSAYIDEDTMYGVGINTCGAYLEARRSPITSTAYEHWMGGYMTAADQMGVVDETDLGGMMGFLDNYCRDNPLEKFSAAAGALRLRLTPPKPTAPTTPPP